jgi:crotonobetainyl-CoA:carnitine CoA-transferase CaiB-like acyl-CoA transferase
LPNRADRLSYHGERAILAENQQQWFAAAFHLSQLLAVDPDNAEGRQRHERALKNHQQVVEGKSPPRMNKLPPP